VHQLLAERQTAQMNAGHVGDQGEAGAADKDKAAAEDEVKRLTAELGKLGFE
jgi:hypothetical protein